MSSRSAMNCPSPLDARTPVLEPLIVIAMLSLLTSWAMQPYIAHSLSQQGIVVQGAAQAALWLTGVLSPVAAFMKAFGAALVCWACATLLGVRMPLLKLLSIFCIAEVLFSLRDVAMWAVLAARGLQSMHTTSDLIVAFGLNAFVQSSSALSKIALQSWDCFTVGWALLAYFMIRSTFKTDSRVSVCLAVCVLLTRILFAAASQLYSV